VAPSLRVAIQGVFTRQNVAPEVSGQNSLFYQYGRTRRKSTH
jgi:hypothetical protein